MMAHIFFEDPSLRLWPGFALKTGWLNAAIFAPFPLGASRDWGPAVWRFYLALSTTNYSLFSSSTTAHLAGKGFSENGGLTRNLTGGLIAVVPVADIPNYRRGRFNRLDQSGVLNDRCQNSPGLLFWAGRVAVTSLTALPTFWFSFGQNDRHFLALYIKTVGVDKKALRPTMVSKIHLRFSTSEEGLIIWPYRARQKAKCSSKKWGGTSKTSTWGGASLVFIFRFSDEIFSYKIEIGCIYTFFGVGMSHVK